MPFTLVSHRSRLFRLLLWALMAVVFLWGSFQAPEWLQLQQFSVMSQQAESSAIIGRYELAARDAAIQHIKVQQQKQQWQLENISRDKKLLLISSGDERLARQWTLQAGSAFAIGDVLMQVEKVESGRLSLRQFLRSGQSILWHYSDDRLWRAEHLLAVCPDSRFKSRLLSQWNRSPYVTWKIARPLLLGGHVLCGQYLGLPELPVDSLRIVANKRQGFDLFLGSALNELALPVYIAPEQAALLSAWQQRDMTGFQTLQRLPLFPETGDILVAGHSFFSITQTAEKLVFYPLSRSQQRLFDPEILGARWEQHSRVIGFSRFPVKQVLGIILLLVVALFISVLMPVSQQRKTGTRQQRLIFVCCMAMAVLGLLTWYHAQRMPVLWSFVFVWSGLLVWLILPWRSQRSSDLLMLLTILLGLGLVTQLQLGLGAAESHWLGYLTKTAGLSAFFLWGMRGLYVYKQRLFAVRMERFFWVYWGLLGFTLLALLLQWMLGSEGGVWGMQPVEFAKLVLVGFAAYSLAQFRRRQTWVRAEWRRRILWLAVAPVLLGFSLVAFALIMLRDFSPLVLMLVWLVGLAFAYYSTESKPWGMLVLSALLGVFVLGIFAVHESPEMVGFLAQSDRINTWAQPALYPHSGYQIRRALEAIYQGGWLGVGSLFSWVPTMTHVTHIPAIQDDFAPSLFVHHFGFLAATALFAMQLLLLVSLSAVAMRCYQVFVVRGHGHHEKSVFGWFMVYFICGGVAMLAGHFIISWATNTALLPVMGQPVPFISAAGSHLLFFVLPVIFIALWVDEEAVDA